MEKIETLETASPLQSCTYTVYRLQYLVNYLNKFVLLRAETYSAKLEPTPPNTLIRVSDTS